MHAIRNGVVYIGKVDDDGVYIIYREAILDILSDVWNDLYYAHHSGVGDLCCHDKLLQMDAH